MLASPRLQIYIGLRSVLIIRPYFDISVTKVLELRKLATKQTQIFKMIEVNSTAKIPPTMSI